MDKRRRIQTRILMVMMLFGLGFLMSPLPLSLFLGLGMFAGLHIFIWYSVLSRERKPWWKLFLAAIASMYIMWSAVEIVRVLVYMLI